MTVQAWPFGVPQCVMPRSVQGGLRDNRLAFDVDDAGPPVERPASSWAPEVYGVDLAPMSVMQFRAFQDWYRVTLAYGTLPFAMAHPVLRTVMAWKIVKADPPYQVRKVLPIGAGSSLRGIVVSMSIMSVPDEV